MTPTDEAKEALEEAHRKRVGLILNHIDPPERAREDNITLSLAIDRAVRTALEAAVDMAHEEYLNAVAADNMSRYDDGHAHGAQRCEQRIRSLISALGLAEEKP